MPAGLQIWDANGNLMLDTTDRLTKVLGTVTTTTSDGSVAVSVPTWGAVWVQTTTLESGDFAVVPRTYYSNGRLYWVFEQGYNTPPAYFRVSTRVTFGVY